MAEPKKLTTEEILALARKQKSDAAAETPSESETPSASPSSTSPESGSAAGPEKPASTEKPKSTAEILAAARAAKGPGSEKPAPAAGDKPKSTAEILAAARAAKGPGQAAGGEKPKSTAEILAAARAGKGAAPAAAKPAEKSPAEAAKTAAAPAGDKPPLKEMVAAVKAATEGQSATAARPPVAARPKLPQKAEKMSRRAAFGAITGALLAPFTLAWTAMTAVAGLWGLGMARYMMPNMVLELPSKFKVGPPSDFPPEAVSEKFKPSRGVWIVRSTQYDGRDLIYALLSICTHLGCTPNWLEGEQKFKCPCHGSGFYITGINFEGPAPRPLERVGLRRAEDGMLEVDKSLKFQEELGQWSDPKSYVLNS